MSIHENNCKKCGCYFETIRYFATVCETCQKDEVVKERDNLRAEVEELKAKQAEDAERWNMQLAAISVASIQNTETTVKVRIDRTSQYWTQAYEDVCRAIDREMKLRAEVERLNDEKRDSLGKWGQVRELVAEVGRLREALKKYGRHGVCCTRWTRSLMDCNCGFAEALAQKEAK